MVGVTQEEEEEAEGDFLAGAIIAAHAQVPLLADVRGLPLPTPWDLQLSQPSLSWLPSNQSPRSPHTLVFGFIRLMGVPRPEETGHSIAIKLSTYCVYCSVPDSEREAPKTLSSSSKKLPLEQRRQGISM